MFLPFWNISNCPFILYILNSWLNNCSHDFVGFSGSDMYSFTQAANLKGWPNIFKHFSFFSFGAYLPWDAAGPGLTLNDSNPGPLWDFTEIIQLCHVHKGNPAVCRSADSSRTRGERGKRKIGECVGGWACGCVGGVYEGGNPVQRVKPVQGQESRGGNDESLQRKATVYGKDSLKLCTRSRCS